MTLLVFRLLLTLGAWTLRRFFGTMVDAFTTAVELAGCVLIVAGVWMLSVPVALMVAGVLMIVVSYLVAD